MNLVPATQSWKVNRVFWGFLVAWVLTMIALPIVRAVADTAVFNWGVTLSVVLQTGAVLAVLHGAWGWRRTLQVAAVVAVLSWAVEFLGSTTGFPFGAYDYTDALQPQLGHVPLLIPLAWFMMLPVAWAIAEHVVGTERRWLFVGVSALALTAWDLFLDPQMVAWGYWVWQNPQGYFGIPWINYFGWFATAALITAVVRPRHLPLLPLLLIYTVTWALESIGLIAFWGLVGPGVVGMLGMGVFVCLGWRAAGGRERAGVAWRPPTGEMN